MKRQIVGNGAWARVLRWIGAIGTVAVMAACGGGGGDGGSPPAGSGNLRLAMTDAPSCGYDHIWITVEKVSVHQNATASDSDAGWTDLALTPPRKIDLLALTNGVLEELGTVPLPAGSYSQIRLVLASNSGTPLANSLQPTGGAVTAMTTPSAQQSGLKLQAHFDVAAGQTADLVLDFNACKSVVKAGNSGQYMLKPVVSVHQRVVTAIQGFVSNTLVPANTKISAQQNGATVRATAPDSTGRFSIPFLSPGSYTLVIQSEGRATAVLTGVTAGTAPTVINGTTTAIVLPASSMAEVTGTVSVTAAGGATTPLTDANVRALQPLTGGPTIELGDQAVDSVLGTYRFRLPVAPTVKAAFVAGGPFTFVPDTLVAGIYTIQASAPGRAIQDKPANISTGSSMTVNFNYGP